MLLLVAAMTLASCGDDDAGDSPPKASVKVVRPENYDKGDRYSTFSVVEVEGRECIVYSGRDGQGGISCNWNPK